MTKTGEGDRLKIWKWFNPLFIHPSYHSIVYKMTLGVGTDDGTDLKVLAPMKIGRSGHGCSIVRAKDGRKYLVVAGGNYIV